MMSLFSSTIAAGLVAGTFSFTPIAINFNETSYEYSSAVNNFTNSSPITDDNVVFFSDFIDEDLYIHDFYQENDEKIVSPKGFGKMEATLGNKLPDMFLPVDDEDFAFIPDNFDDI